MAHLLEPHCRGFVHAATGLVERRFLAERLVVVIARGFRNAANGLALPALCSGLANNP